jgi:hypothetical protein
MRTMSEQEKVFVPSWVTYFNWVVLWFPLGAILGMGLAVMRFGADVVVEAIKHGMLTRLVTPAIGTVLVAVFARLVVPTLCRVSVGKDRIAGRDAWGRHASLVWDDVAEPRQINICGLKSLRVSSRGGGRALWLPGTVADNPDFVVAVAECAGPTHPLSAHLSSRRITTACT